MQFRKKPVVIEAIQLPRVLDADGLAEQGRNNAWLQTHCPEFFIANMDGAVIIKTLEGLMRAEPGDYIIRGVAGECYPCKPDIFADTYERVEEPQPA